MLLYNLLMAAVDLAALVVLWRRRSFAVWCLVIGCAAVAAVVLSGVFGMGSFGTFRLATCGLFLHGVGLLAASALLLWPSKRKTAILSATAAGLLGGVGVDAFLIEPTHLEISHREFVSPKVSRPLRIAVLADLQTDQIGPYERDVFRRLLDKKPDLILLAGDYLQAHDHKREALAGQLKALLHECGFSAPAGVFAVGGNIDPYDWPEFFQGLLVTAVRHSESFQVAGITLTCLSEPDSRSRRLRLASPDPDRFHVVLGHRPDFALGEIDAELMIAGHTHGGQVQLPGIGPLITLSGVPRSWASGLTDLPGGRKLLVSRGVGMERHGAPRIRFFCRPELVIIDLVPSGGSTNGREER